MSIRDFQNMSAMDSAERDFCGAHTRPARTGSSVYIFKHWKHELEAIAQSEEVEGGIEPTYSVLHRSAGT